MPISKTGDGHKTIRVTVLCIDMTAIFASYTATTGLKLLIQLFHSDLRIVFIPRKLLGIISLFLLLILPCYLSDLLVFLVHLLFMFTATFILMIF